MEAGVVQADTPKLNAIYSQHQAMELPVPQHRREVNGDVCGIHGVRTPRSWKVECSNRTGSKSTSLPVASAHNARVP